MPFTGPRLPLRTFSGDDDLARQCRPLPSRSIPKSVRRRTSGRTSPLAGAGPLSGSSTEMATTPRPRTEIDWKPVLARLEQGLTAAGGIFHRDMKLARSSRGPRPGLNICGEGGWPAPARYNEEFAPGAAQPDPAGLERSQRAQSASSTLQRLHPVSPQFGVWVPPALKVNPDAASRISTCLQVAGGPR